MGRRGDPGPVPDNNNNAPTPRQKAMPGAQGRGGGELRELEAPVARTLEACTGRVEGRLPPPPGGLDAWEACPKFHHAVQALQEGLRALEAAGGGGPARAAAYRDRVEVRSGAEEGPRPSWRVFTPPEANVARKRR